MTLGVLPGGRGFGSSQKDVAGAADSLCFCAYSTRAFARLREVSGLRLTVLKNGRFERGAQEPEIQDGLRVSFQPGVS